MADTQKECPNCGAIAPPGKELGECRKPVADTKQGQVDWGALVADGERKCNSREEVVAWLRTTFEPLVMALTLADACGSLCTYCAKEVRAALDRLPKVGGV